MGAVDHNSPEALFALMLTLPAQVVVGHTPRSLRKKDSSNFRFLLILGMVPPIIENPPISAVTVEMGG